MRPSFVKSLALASLLAITGCSFLNSNALVGTWKLKTTGEPHHIEFGNDGSFNLLDDKMQPQLNDSRVKVTYEAITEVEPHQLYTVFTTADKTDRNPLGIYKIENNKLIIRRATEYHRTLGGIDVGVSRYELPADFNGELDIYERVK